MPFDFAGMAGDASGWAGGMAQSVRPVTDLSPHVSGGQSATSPHGNATADVETRQNLWLAAGIVLSAIALLWLFGALIFRGITI